MLVAAAQHLTISPLIFQKKKESRFKFAHSVAHSVDPYGNSFYALRANQNVNFYDDGDEI